MPSYSFEHAKSFDRHVIDIKERRGIPSEHWAVLYDAMKALETEQPLLVTLFFMADLAVEEHTYANIEENLRQIFPPIGESRLKPDDFHKFRKTYITNVLKGNSTLFAKPKRGRWVNTKEGNKAAINVLRKEHVSITMLTLLYVCTHYSP